MRSMGLAGEVGSRSRQIRKPSGSFRPTAWREILRCLSDQGMTPDRRLAADVDYLVSYYDTVRSGDKHGATRG
jgi:hypothetical protein